MNHAPSHAEQWVKHHDRLILTDVEQFLPAPLPVLLNRSGLNNLRQPTIGAELRLLIERSILNNMVGNPTFITPQPAVPYIWSFSNPPWSLSGNAAHKITGDEEQLLIPDLFFIAGVTYTVTFTLSSYVGPGAITPDVASQLGTDRTANGTYTEDIVAGTPVVGDPIFRFRPAANFAGAISNVVIVPKIPAPAIDVGIYTAPDALAANRSTESYATISLPSDLKLIVRHLRFLKFLDSAGGVDIGLKLHAAYPAEPVYASLWTRRYWWGHPGIPT